MAWTEAARAKSLAVRRARAKRRGTSTRKKPFRAATSRTYRPGTRQQRTKSEIGRSVTKLAKKKGVKLSKPASRHTIKELRMIERRLKSKGGTRLTTYRKRK